MKKTQKKTTRIVKSDTKKTPSNKAKTVSDRASDFKENRIATPQKQVTAPDASAITIVAEPMLVGDFAEKMHIPTSDIILVLLRWGILSAKNQRIEKDIIVRLANHYGATIAEPQKVSTPDTALGFSGEHIVQENALTSRLPVVVVLGHVDHGKTSLLDYIRKTRVADKEKGGITQHIGAYEAVTDHGNVIFIDTPGHEAFSKIRQRGAQVADIAILVIAGDDGMMPQTVEAIKHIKNAKIPVVVAVNKADKIDPSRIDIVKRQLAQQDLLPEDWGGQVVVVPISAKTGQGIDTLLEMVVLQAQLLELRAEVNTPYKGYVLESKMEKGRGAVATVLGKHGTLRIGDYFSCGDTTGKVTSLVRSSGQATQVAGPSVPVLVAGFDGQAQVGDYFKVVEKEEWRQVKAATVTPLSMGAASANQRPSQDDTILLLVKVDTNSSREALLDAIEKVARNSPVGISVVASSIGFITESDVELAYTTGAYIIGLHTKAESKALYLAQQRNVSIKLFDIIYKLLEYLEQYAESKRTQEYVSQKSGEAVVLKVFDIKNVGVIAGCRITDGKFTKDGSVVVWRGRYKIGEGKITSLQREKRTVKEVMVGFECGIGVEGVIDFLPDDRIECFIQIPVSPK